MYLPKTVVNSSGFIIRVHVRCWLGLGYLLIVLRWQFKRNEPVINPMNKYIFLNERSAQIVYINCICLAHANMTANYSIKTSSMIFRLLRFIYSKFILRLLTMDFSIDDYSLYTLANYELNFSSIDLDSVRYRHEDALVV